MTTHDVAERLSRLERQNRRMKQIGITAATLTAAALFVGQANQPADSAAGRVIEAEKFVLRGPDGYLRGEWTATSNGNALLTMYDRNRNKRSEWAVYPSGSAVFELLDEEGKARITWKVKKTGEPMLSVHDRAANVRARWGIFSTGKTAMLMFDRQGNAVWTAP